MAVPRKSTYTWIIFMFTISLFSDTRSRLVKKDSYIAQRVRMAMNTLESASCVRFKSILVKPTENINWIHFTNPKQERNCVHAPQYRTNGEIILVLGFDCLKMNEILHTLLHAIGFKDEVSHPHRDQYIRILWNNIQPEYRQLYQIQYHAQPTSKVLVEYNPRSIMHFHDRAFSLNGQATVMPLVPGMLISPSSALSQLDKLRLRLLFDHECNKRKVGDMIDTCKTIFSNSTNGNMKSKDVHDSVEDKMENEYNMKSKDVHDSVEDKTENGNGTKIADESK